METNNKKMISYFLLIISVCVLFLFTKNMIFDVQANLEKKTQQEALVQEKTNELNRLSKLKNVNSEEVEKYVKEIKENEIIEYVYGLIETLNLSRELGRGSISVQNLTLTQPKQNEYGFLETDINLQIQVTSETKMKKLLDRLVAEDAPYKIFITSFAYETPDVTTSESVSATHGQQSEAFSVTIPLKIFYK